MYFLIANKLWTVENYNFNMWNWLGFFVHFLFAHCLELVLLQVVSQCFPEQCACMTLGIFRVKIELNVLHMPEVSCASQRRSSPAHYSNRAIQFPMVGYGFEGKKINRGFFFFLWIIQNVFEFVGSRVQHSADAVVSQQLRWLKSMWKVVALMLLGNQYFYDLC